ncbi:MAG: hypothetical protein IJ731_08610 [Eubacterium sp.]|nr:hypothetical protein [Eubacterium sp.]
MLSVTMVAGKEKQPRGGYVRPRDFSVIQLQDDIELFETENVSPIIIGLAVDYLTRVAMGSPKEKAFGISIEGANRAEQAGNENSAEKANDLLKRINGLDDESITAACKIATFDVWLRNPFGAALAKGEEETNPDSQTISNIRTMVKRSVKFFEEYGPITQDGFTFKPNGYSMKVSSGDGDFLTKDTMWDFKVSKNPIKSKHTLQLLMYWIMGQHSGNEIFKGITKIGFFNPRQNKIMLLDVNQIDKSIIEYVENEIIEY